jgi:hypothetical protein
MPRHQLVVPVSLVSLSSLVMLAGCLAVPSEDLEAASETTAATTGPAAPGTRPGPR